MNKKKKIVCLSLIIIWMIVIFLFSNMDSKNSNSSSKNIIENVVDVLQEVNIIDKDLTNREKSKLITTLNKPLRKCMHATIYFVLAILLITLLKNINFVRINPFLLTLIICFVYACTDEYHQTFIYGRSGQFSDVLIDTCGSILALIVYKYFLIIRNKRKKQIA